MLLGLVQVPLAREASPTNKKTTASVQTIDFFTRNTRRKTKFNAKPGRSARKARPLHGTSRRMPAATAESKLQQAAQHDCGLMRFHLCFVAPAISIIYTSRCWHVVRKECYLYEGSLASLISSVPAT